MEQKNKCRKSIKFDTFEEATAACSMEINPTPSKIKIVRRGSKRSSVNEYYELRLYDSVKQKDTTDVKKKGKKKT